MTDSSNLQQVRRYLQAIEEGAFNQVTAMFAPGMTFEQLPNLLSPKGSRADLSQMAAASEKGKKLLSEQSYEIKNAVANGDAVAVEVLWRGKLATGFGNLSAGSEMRAHCAMFFEFKDGRIVRQRNYDCFEPW